MSAAEVRVDETISVSVGGADPVDGPLRRTARLSAIGRQKHARDKPTVSPSAFCDQYARDCRTVLAARRSPIAVGGGKSHLMRAAAISWYQRDRRPAGLPLNDLSYSASEPPHHP